MIVAFPGYLHLHFLTAETFFSFIDKNQIHQEAEVIRQADVLSLVHQIGQGHHSLEMEERIVSRSSYGNT